MPRKAMKGVAPRTFRVDLESYNSILQFFDKSPSGITGTHAIREVLKQFGHYCQQQSDAGEEAGPETLVAAKGIVLGMLERSDDRDT